MSSKEEYEHQKRERYRAEIRAEIIPESEAEFFIQGPKLLERTTVALELLANTLNEILFTMRGAS